jgi:hypothetical protein
MPELASLQLGIMIPLHIIGGIIVEKESVGAAYAQALDGQSMTSLLIL